MNTLKLTLCTLFITVVSLSDNFAQNYKPFEWDIFRLGYVIPGGEGATGGIALSTEPRYNLKDNLSLGLRAEIALFGSDAEDESVDVGASGSFALIGDYYFNTESSSRPFAGVGLGSFSAGDVTVTSGRSSSTVEGGSSIGFIARAGYELGLLRITGEYNLLTSEGSSNYLGIHLGLTIGGKYKN